MLRITLILIYFVLCTPNIYGNTEESPMYEPITRLFNCRLVRENGIFEEDLWISGGKIIHTQQTAEVEIDMEGRLIAPGYIDIQINGGFGIDFTREPERVEEVAKLLPRFGVTSFVPTLVSSDAETYKRAIPLLHPRKVEGGAEILGCHLEGPFLNPKKKGAHAAAVLASCPKDYEELEAFYGPMEQNVRIITLAPELPGAPHLISELEKRAFIVSAGHSDANTEEAEAGVAAGVRLTTHLFNAMRPFHHRDPGLIGVTLAHRRQYYSLIADGIHLHDSALNMAYKTHPQGCILVSDAMAALGLEPGTYTLGDQEVSVEAHVARLAGQETLAGSACPLDHCVRHLKQATGCSATEAIQAASLHPAKLLRIHHTKGILEIGADADFVVLDDKLNLSATVIAGDTVWGTL